MRAILCLLVLGGTATASAAALTGNELVLLRMIFRQEMAREVAAADPNDAAAAQLVEPLQMALADVPRIFDWYLLVNDSTQSVPARLNAARALAYFGDATGVEFLSSLLRARSRSFPNCPEWSQAGLALLYLGHDFPAGFAFSRLSPPLYPELDAFLGTPAEVPWHVSPYKVGQLRAALALYLGSDDRVQVRGPLSILTVEQESLTAVLREAAEHPDRYLLRVPFGDQVYEWEQFKDQMLADDLLYHFIAGDPVAEVEPGLEGYALIREGQVVAAILTAGRGPVEAGLLLLDDFAGSLNSCWEIVNSDPSHWSLSSVPGALTITTQDGTFVRARRDYRNIFLTRCPAAPGQDFQVTTCLLSFAPSAMWSQAGLLLWNSDDHYLKFNYEFCNDPLGSGFALCIHTLALEVDGSPMYTWYLAPQDPEKLWLRIVKRGAFCHLLTSTDGQSFSSPTVLATDGGYPDAWPRWGDAAVNYVGLYAENGSALDGPAVGASFDFFEVRALPAGAE
jgi:regulation of enolase protein 1 (concanavalin A-like superfamily)